VTYGNGEAADGLAARSAGTPCLIARRLGMGGGPVLGARLESRGGACPESWFSCGFPRLRAHVPYAWPGGCVFADDPVSGSCGLGGCLPRRAAHEVDGGDLAQEGEVPAAAGAGVGLRFGEVGLWVGVGSEVQADDFSRGHGGGAHEPVVAHPRKSLGQDVDEPAAYEFVRAEGEDAGLSRTTASPVDADVPLFVVADDAFWADGAAFDVAGEVAQGGVAFAYVLELDVPGFPGMENGFGGGWEGLVNVQVVGLQAFAQEGTEALGEGAEVDEETVFAGAEELLFSRMPCEGRDDEVDMRVVLELPSPGVEHGGEACDPAFGFGGDDVAQGGGGLFQDEVVEFLRVGEACLAQLLWQGEGDHEVRDGQ